MGAQGDFWSVRGFRAEDRCSRLPMDSIPALSRTTAAELPPAIRSHWRQRLPRRCGRLLLTNCPVGRIVRAGRPFPHTSNLSLNLAGAVSAPCKLAGGQISLGPRTILKSSWIVNTLGHNSCLQGSRGNAQSSDPKQRAGVESAH